MTRLVAESQTSFAVGAANPALAGVFEPGASFDEAEARDVLAQPFGSNVASDVVHSGPLAGARTPAGRDVRGSPTRAHCLLAGRIYNLDEIAAAYGLDRDEDAELLLAAAYEHAGNGLVEALSGAFVVVLWDSLEKRGVVAQDQLGTRSLYYYEAGRRLYFASDVFALLRMLPRRPAPSSECVVRLLANAPPPPELTPYEGVKRAAAGHLLELGDGGWKRRRYWEPRYRPLVRGSAAFLGEELWNATRRAVRTRLGQDGRPGIIMSGGLDSALVAAAASVERRDRAFPRTYSAVFPGQPWIDESPRIERLAESLDLPGVRLTIDPEGVFALSLQYLLQWDLPSTGPGYMVEHALIASAANDGVTTLLDGQGGNEIFGFSPFLMADRLRHGRVVSSLRLARAFPSLRTLPWKQTLAVWRRFGVKGALPYRLQRAVRQRRGHGRYVPAYFTPESARALFESHDPLSWKRDAKGPLWWAYKSYVTTQLWEETRLPEYLRHRAATAGIEARPPLMDVPLIELALSVSPERDFSATYDRPLIREGLRGRIPSDVRLWREKSNLGPLYQKAMLADIESVRRILGPDAETRAFVRRDIVGTMLEHPPELRGPRYLDWASFIWSLVAVECWLRQQSDQSFARKALDSRLFQAPSARVHGTRA